MPLEAFLENAVQIVRDAGQIARPGFGNTRVLRVKQRGDPVTEGDLQVQEYVDSRLRELYPDHGLNAEENTDQNTEGSPGGSIRNADAEYVWVLDPIDGTKYYLRGVPLYSIALALEQRGKLILGVVLFPETGQLFCGARGCGAKLEGKPVACSRTERLDQSTICAEIPSRDSPAADRRWALQKLALLVDRTQRVRIMGLAPFGLCFTATGGFDAYVNLGSAPKYCDIAAGQVIVEEAGGRFWQPGQTIVAGPDALCRQLLDVLDVQREP